MTPSKICETPKKSISKFSLALLIVVISFATTNVSANELFERKLTAICKNKLALNSAYERTHRKCFTFIDVRRNWQVSERACEKLPRLEHFGPPKLATFDLNRDQMANWMRTYLGAQTCTLCYWTGAYIPFRHVHKNKKLNNEWRWVADDSKLSASYSGWDPGHPTSEPERVCAAFDCEYAPVGIWDTYCGVLCRPLCQYEAENLEVCPHPPVPKNAELMMENKIEMEWGVLLPVRCRSGYVVKGTEHETEQVIKCKRGKWTETAHDCV